MKTSNTNASLHEVSKLSKMSDYKLWYYPITTTEKKIPHAAFTCELYFHVR